MGWNAAGSGRSGVAVLVAALSVVVGACGCATTPRWAPADLIGVYSGRSRLTTEFVQFSADGTVTMERCYLWPARPHVGPIRASDIDLKVDLHHVRMTGTWHIVRDLVRTQFVATHGTGHFGQMSGRTYTASWSWAEGALVMWTPVRSGGATEEASQDRRRTSFGEFYRIRGP